MASIMIDDMDEALTRRLQLQAAKNGRSVEAEALDILRSNLSFSAPPVRNLADAIRTRIAALGGVELEIEPRELVSSTAAGGELISQA